jgi:hypothetical protein
LGVVVAVVVMSVPAAGGAEDPVFDKKIPADRNDIINGGRGVSTRSAVAGVCSLIIPGIGQAVNENAGKKVAVHLVVGLLPLIAVVHPVGLIFALFHIWSAWDALIDRRGGYINGTVSVPGDALEASGGSGGFMPARAGSFGGGYSFARG